MSKEATKGRILTAKEIEIAEALASAMLGKTAAVSALAEFRKEIGRQTREIAKLPRIRHFSVWAEVREKTGSPAAPTREQLAKGT